MKQAIITGGTGKLGRNVVKYFLENKIQVLVISRKKPSHESFIEFAKFKNFKLCQLDLKKIELLPKKLGGLKWKINDSCVFYHFAWEGKNTLTDGDINIQIDNILIGTRIIEIAKKLGCIKFINSGSIEENCIKDFFNKKWINNHYHSNQAIYSATKLSAKDFFLLTAYINKIDYIHTRFSAFYDNDFSFKGYINQSFKKILIQENVDFPKNAELFDLINIKDLAKAYFLLGIYGKNKEDYFIGTGSPLTLFEYFKKLADLKNIKLKFNEKDDYEIKKSTLNKKYFNVEKLKSHTGFNITNNLFK